MVASLCKIYDASEDELRIVIDKANNLVETILKKKPSPASDCQTDKLDNIDPGWSKIIFLLQLKNHVSSLNSCLIVLRIYGVLLQMA